VDLPSLLSDIPYQPLVPVAIQLVKFAIDLWRQPRSKPPSHSPISPPRPKEATMTRYLVLYTERIQKLRLPDDVDVPELKAVVTDAIETGRCTSIRVIEGGVQSDLVLNGSRIPAFTVVEVPTQNVVGL
jgi:hypothetical protein